MNENLPTSVPHAEQHPGDPTVLRASAITTATYVASSILDVSAWRKVTLYVDVDAGAASDALTLIPLFSGSRVAPATAIVDEWFVPCVTDGSLTAAALSATLLSGADFTAAPAFGEALLQPLVFTFTTSTDAANERRFAITLDCSAHRFFHFQLADEGAGTKATVAVTAVRSA